MSDERTILRHAPSLPSQRLAWELIQLSDEVQQSLLSELYDSHRDVYVAVLAELDRILVLTQFALDSAREIENEVQLKGARSDEQAAGSASRQSVS